MLGLSLIGHVWECCTDLCDDIRAEVEFFVEDIKKEVGGSSSSSSTTSDETSRTREALKTEENEVEEKAWNAFSKQLQSLERSLKKEAKELEVGKVSLRGKDDGRVVPTDYSGNFGSMIGASFSASSSASIAASIGATKGVNGSIFPNFDDGGKIKLPMFSFRKSSLKGEATQLRKKIGRIDSVLLEQNVLWNPNALIASKGLTKPQRTTLLDFCPESDIEELDQFIQEANELRPRLAATGVLKAGKSTMMNCLTGDFSNERFKVGIVRETTSMQVYEQDGYLFVDTPGIDANDQDTQVAEEALRRADVILFSHNMNGGGLDKPERAFLESIRTNWDNATDFVDKTVFVLTHLDKLDKKKEDRALVESEVSNQVEEIFGSKPVLVSVSSSRYLKGMLENKPLLVKKSNYSELKKVIEEKTKNVGRQKKKRYRRRIKENTTHLKCVLLSAKDEWGKEVKLLESEHQEACKAFREKVKTANGKVAKAYAVYLTKIEKESA